MVRDVFGQGVYGWRYGGDNGWRAGLNGGGLELGEARLSAFFF